MHTDSEMTSIFGWDSMGYMTAISLEMSDEPILNPYYLLSLFAKLIKYIPKVTRRNSSLLPAHLSTLGLCPFASRTHRQRYVKCSTLQRNLAKFLFFFFFIVFKFTVRQIVFSFLCWSDDVHTINVRYRSLVQR